MSRIFPPTKIFISESRIPDSGRGVFASENIDKGAIIEVAPILILDFTDFVDTKWNLLFEYYFWMDDYVALALGFASIYNHSATPNAKYELSKSDQTITFIALRDIDQDEEIVFNYKGSTSSSAPLWFERKNH